MAFISQTCGDGHDGQFQNVQIWNWLISKVPSQAWLAVNCACHALRTICKQDRADNEDRGHRKVCKTYDIVKNATLFEDFSFFEFKTVLPPQKGLKTQRDAHCTTAKYYLSINPFD